MKGFAVDGATTNHGGVIRATQKFHDHIGLPVLRAGDGHYCPQCKCWSTIQKSHDHLIIEGQSVAYEDDLLSCGAKIMHQQRHIVGDSQGSFTISFGDLPNESLTPNSTSDHSTNSFANTSKELLNGHYYNIETGLYEGKITTGKGSLEDVYACKGKISDTDFIAPQNANITHQKFQECARVVSHESGTATIECIYIAFTANNYAKQTKKSLHSLLMSGYSTMPAGTKTPLPDQPGNGKKEDPKYSLARKGVLKVCLNEEDPTNGATHWDGTDFLAWGLTSPYKKPDGSFKPHAKFREYNKIIIPKSIFDSFLAGTLKEYPKGKVKYSGTLYDIPATVFKDNKNWISGNFEYVTGVKSKLSLTAKVTAGHTVFWKAS